MRNPVTFLAVVILIAPVVMKGQTLPEAVVRLYSGERQRCGEAFELSSPIVFPERNGIVRVDVLVSCGGEGGWRFRNRLDRIFLKEGKIEAVGRPGAPANFWDAVLIADSFLFVDVPEQGAPASFLTVDGRPVTVPFPVPAAGGGMREPGRYLYPVPGGYPLREISMETVMEFRRLSPEAEADWLRRRLFGIPPSAEAVELLKRLGSIGEFSAPMSASRREIWRKLLLEQQLGNAPRRLLFALLSEANFLPCEAFVSELLADPLLGRETAEEFRRRNRTAFRELIIRWSGETERRKLALRYSEDLADDPLYRTRLLAAFRNPDPEDLLCLIPVYALEASNRGSQELKKVLKVTPYPGNYRLLCRTAEWILKTHPELYVAEIRGFLFRERNNPDLKRGVLYPLLLASLCRAGDAEGTAAAVTYLKALKDPGALEAAGRIWGRGMKGVVTVDRILRELDGK